MMWHVVRRVLLVGALAVTLPLPIVYGLQTVAALTGVGGAVLESPGFEPFLTALGFLMLVCAAVGVTIVWRRPGNRVGILLVVGALMLTSVATAWPWLVEVGPEASGPVATLLMWWSPIGILPSLFVLFPSVVLVFPDGNFPGRRWATAYTALVVALVTGIALSSIAPWPIDPANGLFGNPFAIEGVPADLRIAGDALMTAAVIAGFVLALASVVVRFRRSAGVERAQVKWLAAAVAVNCILFPASYVSEIQPDALLDLLSVAAASLIPASIGIAVLRYHLYEIDRIISRTVSWSIVTGAVVVTFAVLVVGLQAVLDRVTQGQTLAVALSTIVVAALFQPVRRSVQRVVDRRFDRSAYDATQAAFDLMEHLRDEVDLGNVASDVLGAVDVTLHPASRSLWIRQSILESSRTDSPVTIPGQSTATVTTT